MSSGNGPAGTGRARSAAASSFRGSLEEERKSFDGSDAFGYCEYGGYKTTQREATGFFRVEQIDRQGGGLWTLTAIFSCRPARIAQHRRASRWR